jgi:hypothetical protein
LNQLREALTAKDEEAVWDRVEELQSWQEWLSLDTFDGIQPHVEERTRKMFGTERVYRDRGERRLRLDGCTPCRLPAGVEGSCKFHPVLIVLSS